MKKWLLILAPVVVLFSLFVVTGLRGVDLGEHWDEIQWHIDAAKLMAHSGVFLPRAYIYPSLSKWLVLLPTLPAALTAALESHGDPVAIQAAIVAVTDAPEFLLTARRVFVVVSGFTIVWMYAATLVLRRSVFEATVAAGCIGLSWEYAYHSRWVANDCVLVQFAALMLLGLALFRRFKQDRWLYLAALAVGAGTGAKQPGVFLLLTVILTSILSLPLKAWRQQILRLIALCGVALVTFLVTTPGILLDPFVFLKDAREISSIYGAGHGQFTASGPVQHWVWVITYLSVEFFSHFHAVSLVLVPVSVFGCVMATRRDWRFVLPLLIFPVAFLGIFCSRYVVMICRNYLQITPLMCLFAARGISEIMVRLGNRWARWALKLALAGTALAHAAWLVTAAESIRHYDPAAYVRQAIHYVAKHPEKQYRISARVLNVAQQQNLVLPPNAVSAPLGQAMVMFGLADMGDPGLYKENDPWLTDAIFGPREVNFNWYAVWGGRDRVVVMPIEKARAGAVPAAK